jgi:hypothetical protein
MVPQAFRHAGRKKGVALDTRSHPTAVLTRQKVRGVALRFMGHAPYPGKQSANQNQACLRRPQGYRAKRGGAATAPIRFVHSERPAGRTRRGDCGQSGSPYIEHIELQTSKTLESLYPCGFEHF